MRCVRQMIGPVLSFSLVAAVTLEQAQAVAVNDIDFADTAVIGRHEVSLRNVATYRYLNLISVYTAGLYLPAEARNDFCRAETPKRLEIAYLVDIAAADFVRSANHVLEKNLAPGELAGLADRIDELHRAYRDVREGDSYSLTYTPEHGTELAFNGTVLVQIPGGDFACAYFGIWLGRDPIDKGLRTSLLQTRR